MLRNTMIYRRYWYVRRKNAHAVSILLRLAIIAGILALLYYNMHGKY